MQTTIYTTTKNGNPLVIEIRCNDKCKNGHDTFAITADEYKKGTNVMANRIPDSKHLSGGCIHNEILAARPDLKIFVDLHLSDGNGVPMYAVENGKYHMRDRKVFKEYLRLTNEEVEEFYAIPYNGMEGNWNTLFTRKIESLYPKWKTEAEAAKKLLSQLITNHHANSNKQ